MPCEPPLAISLINQVSLISNEIGKSSEALPLAEEAYRIACDGGFAPLAKQMEPIIEVIRKKSRESECGKVCRRWRRIYRPGVNEQR